ncbi:MAG: hypothetical protein IIX93_11900 [Clostridia bacterium]|nr:hypothetical protein [Clostridia bacterium]
MKRFLLVLLVIFLAFSSLAALSEAVPYLVKLPAEREIFKGPGEEYERNGLVGKNGTYTIVEEQYSSDGYLWGRLKSGAGWVRLSDAPVISEDNWFLPYTIKLPAWVSIFKGPGYDYVYTKLVGADGVYTIVEEAFDEEGNLWGRLKSGAGWVDLTYASWAETLPAVISFADSQLLMSGEYIFRQPDASEYSVKIAVRANELLRNVRFTSLTLGEMFWETDEVLYSARYMQDWRPLVIEVTFWGDMTTFGFDFTDDEGFDRHYLISVSGRNGQLYVQEYLK